MSTIRTIRQVLTSQPTLEGAGVHLKRAFGYAQAPQLDPFLLLDDFHSDDPAKYAMGFPWHPHRGIETITYMLQGRVEHGDSLGNRGVIAPGDVQWMTAGSGIVHQEMPQGDESGRMWGLQLWANLPAAHKMMDPRYRDITREQIPQVTLEGGAQVRVICGQVDGVRGPVQDVVIDPEYLDVTLPSGTGLSHRVPRGYTAFAYVLQGAARFEPGEQASLIGAERLVIWEDGDELSVVAGDRGTRFVLVSGQPLGEPIAWRGPIVMNTQQELALAFEEYRRGTFLKHG